MQLTVTPRPPSVRGQLGAAACLLLASSVPALAQSDSAATTRIDASALLYGERGRTDVVEPVARVTRLWPDGQSVSAELGIDVITGASPTGAMPSGRVQTTTSASGNVTTIPAGAIPVHPFQDVRGVLDLQWQKPVFPLFTTTVGTHVSREKDYQSLGASGKLSLDLLHRLSTLTVGGSYDRDDVFPIGGVPVPLSEGTGRLGRSQPKRAASGMVGLSRVLTRRWMAGVTASRTLERGYLTEPYKVVSLVDDTTGLTTGSLAERRPSTRDRRDLIASSVYHLSRDVLYLSYRYYWDDWRVRSHTVDLRYRKELDDRRFVQPHLRLYAQTAADFFAYGLLQSSTVPAFATSDYRLGPLRTATLGATYGFHVTDVPGDWTVRAEYMLQWGNGHPGSAVGVQRTFDLMPPLSIGSLVVGYSCAF